MGLLINSKNVSNFSDIFGMFKISNTGSYMVLISGSLFPKKP